MATNLTVAQEAFMRVQAGHPKLGEGSEFEKPFRSEQLVMDVDYAVGEDVEVALSDTIAGMLEAIAGRIRRKALEAPQTISLSTETQILSVLLLADLEYWNGN